MNLSLIRVMKYMYNFIETSPENDPLPEFQCQKVDITEVEISYYKFYENHIAHSYKNHTFHNEKLFLLLYFTTKEHHLSELPVFCHPTAVSRQQSCGLVFQLLQLQYGMQWVKVTGVSVWFTHLQNICKMIRFLT